MTASERVQTAAAEVSAIISSRSAAVTCPESPAQSARRSSSLRRRSGSAPLPFTRRGAECVAGAERLGAHPCDQEAGRGRVEAEAEALGVGYQHRWHLARFRGLKVV